MSFFELFCWVVILCVLIASAVVLLEMAWVRYCSWSIQRDRDLFWAALEEVFARRRARHVKPAGPYR